MQRTQRRLAHGELSVSQNARDADEGLGDRLNLA